jgi:hypothetical protein
LANQTHLTLGIQDHETMLYLFLKKSSTVEGRDAISAGFFLRGHGAKS